MIYLSIGVIVLIMSYGLYKEDGFLKGPNDTWGKMLVVMFLIVILWPVFAIMLVVKEMS